MIVDEQSKEISFRQSWLGTAFRCPEEARWAINHPEMEQCSDEAFIGTAAHAGIEAFINGASQTDARKAVRCEYTTNDEARDLRFTKRSGIDECIDYSERCFDAWFNDIRPHAPLEGARAEVGFEVPVFEYRGYLAVIKGTADLIPAVDDPWDWKTAGGEYRQKAKQMWAIQPTIYSMAAVLGGFGRNDFTWPMKFTYGVMVKRVNECRGQMLVVERTEEHAEWAMHRMRGFIDMYLDMGLARPWPMVDEDNYLCSAKWCSFYDECRGKYVSKKADLFGYDPK